MAFLQWDLLYAMTDWEPVSDLLSRWRLVFSWRLWNWLSPYWSKCFFTMIMVLIVLFLGKQHAVSQRQSVLSNRAREAPVKGSCSSSRTDAVREVQKYSGPEPMQDVKVNPNLYDHIHMKLFRAQRNLYISGFSLFLWLLVNPIHYKLNKTDVPLPGFFVHYCTVPLTSRLLLPPVVWSITASRVESSAC